MNIDAKLYTFLVGGIILLSIVCVSLVVSYVTTVKRLRKLEKNEDDLYKKTIEEEKSIVERSQTEYQETLHQAQEKANEIVANAGQINNDSQKALTDAVNTLTEKEKQQVSELTQTFMKSYQAELSEINNNTINVLKSTSDDLIKSMTSNFEELKKSMSEETFKSHEVAEEKIKVEYDKLEQELHQYKEAQLKKLNDNIYKILLNVSKALLNKSINFEQHGDLIMEALEKAKKEDEFAS